MAEKALQALTDTLEQQVAERTKLAEARFRQLQKLTKELIEAEEQERRRIASLLHDDLQQYLASAWMQVQTAREQHPSIELLKNVESMLKESIEESRDLSIDSFSVDSTFFSNSMDGCRSFAICSCIHALARYCCRSSCKRSAILRRSRSSTSISSDVSSCSCRNRASANFVRSATCCSRVSVKACKASSAVLRCVIFSMIAIS